MEKNVFITGATGGIGGAVVNYFSEKGFKVFACDVKEGKFDNPSVEFLKADVSDENGLQAIKKNLAERQIELDAIINVAGVFDIDSFIEADNEKLRKIFDVNFFGTVYVNKILHSLLKKNGRIVVTTSDVAPLDPMPFNGIYGVSKTALDAYSQSLRQELNLIGQKVITVRPGAFDTSLSRGSLVKTEELAENTVLYKEQSAKFYALVKKFMGKACKPEKIAKVYYKAVTAKRPKIIYKKHPNILLAMLNVLPKSWQCAIVKRLLK